MQKTAISSSFTDDYAVNPLNQYTTITPSTSSPVTTLGYDTNGNLNSVTQLGETRTLTYDAQNRLLGTNVTGDGQTYAYDPSGRVAYRIINGTLRVHTWTGSALIEDRDATGTQLAEYIQGGTGELLSKESAGTKTYYHHDAQGNVIALTSPTGAIVERYKYDAFGNVTISGANGVPLTPQVSAYGNRWMYSGMESLAMTGMGQLGVYGYRNRVYSALLGIPLSFQISFNVYPTSQYLARCDWIQIPFIGARNCGRGLVPPFRPDGLRRIDCESTGGKWVKIHECIGKSPIRCANDYHDTWNSENLPGPMEVPNRLNGIMWGIFWDWCTQKTCCKNGKPGEPNRDPDNPIVFGLW